MKRPLKNFPTRYEDVPLRTQGPWFDAAKRAHAALSKSGIVCLYGNRGTGKTLMACDLAKHGKFQRDETINGYRRPAIYMTAMELFLSIRNTWGNDSSMSELALIDFWSNAVLLVIDEIQERGETPFENQKLTAIIDARYRYGRPTLLIGNYATSRELASSLGSSISSRMMETGGVIHCDWPSFRTGGEKS